MQLDLGVFNGNLVNVTLGIKIVVRIKALNKIFKRIEIISYFFLIYVIDIFFIYSVSVKNINRRIQRFH